MTTRLAVGVLLLISLVGCVEQTRPANAPSHCQHFMKNTQWAPHTVEVYHPGFYQPAEFHPPHETMAGFDANGHYLPGIIQPEYMEATGRYYQGYFEVEHFDDDVEYLCW